jgi:hypothetical protein
MPEFKPEIKTVEIDSNTGDDVRKVREIVIRGNFKLDEDGSYSVVSKVLMYKDGSIAFSDPDGDDAFVYFYPEMAAILRQVLRGEAL